MKKQPILILLFALSLLPAACQSSTFNCGNGIIEEDEQCDGDDLFIFPNDLSSYCPAGKTLSKSSPRCSRTCQIDLTSVCVDPFCGNGILETGEECDGSAIAVNVANLTCADGQPDYSKLGCDAQCHIIDNGICGKKAAQCGNGILEDSEPCDGNLFNPKFLNCPGGYTLVENPVFTCNSCTSIELTNACRPNGTAPGVCGDDQLSVGEICDNAIFAQGAKTCPDGYEITDESQFLCINNCTAVDYSRACSPITEPTTPQLVFSEAVPSISDTLDAVAMEIANIDKKSINLAECRLHFLDNDGYEMVNYSLEGQLQPKDVSIFCLKDESSSAFNGLCRQTFPKPAFNKVGALYIQCGEDIIDTFRFSSFIVGVSYGLSYSLRRCSAKPEPEIGSIDDSWLHYSHTTIAPNYNLGKHCNLADKVVASCVISADKSRISSNADTIQLTMDLKVPGLTDLSGAVDADTGLMVSFAFPDYLGTTVAKSTFRSSFGSPSPGWTSADGTDRYAATFETSDPFIGFLASENGTYVIDGKVSLNNGENYITCGTAGIVMQPETLSGTEPRATLVVDL